MPRRATYRQAGVHLQAADRWVQDLRRLLRTTRRPGVLGKLEGFGGLLRLPAARGDRQVLVASADGAGTKVKLAQLAGRHAGIGTDVVAMNVNDIITFGATPLLFLDYLAMSRLHRTVLQELMRGMVQGCRDSRCVLLGGETAEMPGCYRPGEYDIAGFAVGLVNERQLVTGRSVRAGDHVVGLASSGVHANGLSLVRRVFATRQLQRHRALLRQLLTPTRLYVRPILAALAQRSTAIKAMAHITGGGLTHRLPSLVAHTRSRVHVQLRQGSWRVPRIFTQIQRAGDMTEEEMLQTFNMGIGFTLVCAPKDVQPIRRICIRFSIPAQRIGTIV